MATLYEYKCEKCDFKIFTNEDGTDCMMAASSQLFVCKGCKRIISLSKPYKFNDPTDYSHIKGFYIFGMEVTDTCPECGRKDTLSRWSPKDGCPKCGSNVELNPFGAIMFSD